MTALTPRQRLVLEYLAAHGGSTVPAVAKGCGLRYETIRLALWALWFRSLVTRLHWPSDYTWHLEQAGVDALRGVGT